MSKHTPGPWHTGEKNKYTVYCKMGQRVANSFDNIPVLSRSDAQCEANACLISVAPEMFDLLQRAVRRLEIEHSHGGTLMREWITEARAAIAKATGEAA